MKIHVLIFIDWFLPGYKAGGPISSNANLIEHLKEEFEFFVVTRDTDYCETAPYPSVISNKWNVFSGAHVHYLSAGKLSFRNLIRISKTVDFDVVYINGIYSVYFSLFPLIWFKYVARKKVVVAARGMLSDHTFSSKKEKKKLFYAFSRTIGLYKGITFHATNKDEADQIRRNVGFKGIIKVAPNLPPKTTITKNLTLQKIPGELRLISIARISPEKNTLYALQILENLDIQATKNQQPTTNPHITFNLYGTIYNEPYWQECLSIINRLPSHIKVNFCGPIEKDKIQTALKDHHFLFMPSQGENYGHSIVESMLAGCPVIISDRTPWRNLDKVQSTKYKVPGTNNLEPATSNQQPATSNQQLFQCIGWDIPLEQPQLFVETIKYGIQMEQEEYESMSLRTFEYAQHITNDQAVIEANKNIFR